MKWQDSGDMVEKEEDGSKEEYFDEEQYSPWAEQKDIKKNFKLGKIQVLSILLAVAVVALVAALLVLLMNSGGVEEQRVVEIEKRIQGLEERLDKYESIDEKVTAIWEQAKTFEKFQERFDRSEASASLRMDHLTMSLEGLQKQFNDVKRARAKNGGATKAVVRSKDKAVDKPEAKAAAVKPASKPIAKAAPKMKYHQVKTGDTFYNISKRYSLKVEQLLQMNQLKADSVIQPGQKLVVGQTK